MQWARGCHLSYQGAAAKLLRLAAEGGVMVGWHLSEQAREALRTARTLAGERGNPSPGSADLLLAAILGQWDEQHAGGPDLLRACGLTAEQASQLTAKLLSAYLDPKAPAPCSPALPRREPAVCGGPGYRIAGEARAPTSAPRT